jgi:hypothetical protein
MLRKQMTDEVMTTISKENRSRSKIDIWSSILIRTSSLKVKRKKNQTKIDTINLSFSSVLRIAVMALAVVSSV